LSLTGSIVNDKISSSSNFSHRSQQQSIIIRPAVPNKITCFPAVVANGKTYLFCMAQKHFVQLKLGSKSFEPTQISTEGCSYVDDFKEFIKAKFSRKLKAYDSYELVLFEADGTTKISAMDSIDQLNGKKKPLVAVVEPVEVQVEPTQKPAISITRHQDYKHSKAVHSSRSYLTTIAVELEKLYALEKAKPNLRHSAIFYGIAEYSPTCSKVTQSS